MVIHSLITTVAKITIKIIVTLGQARVLRAALSFKPIPPAPTKRNTVDSRILISQLNTLIPAKVGATCGNTPQAKTWGDYTRPERWKNRSVRNWKPVKEVWLNPSKESNELERNVVLAA